ncbi:ACT domain-containing protein [Schaalia sp. Marseille-Q2122]|uniref:ACT domain-containing protein n=1 Tax=Schaalia sp. Marseille-Q2122 TaxID=2736604 RepID=UPI0015891C67|nr:ACT domain-containing protein [Schaalia sp. Marseille-Q2122]
MSALSDLDQVLASLDPTPEGVYVFASVDEVPAGLHPFAQIREAEGITVITTFEDAKEAGLPLDETYARITLGVHSALNAVGLTATVAQTMASRSISCNVIAGYHHDHLFVQADRQAEAVALLKELAESAQGWLPTAEDLLDDDIL